MKKTFMMLCLFAFLGLCPPAFGQEPLLAGRGCCSHHGGVCGCSGGRAQCCDGSLSPSCRCRAEEIGPEDAASFSPKAAQTPLRPVSMTVPGAS